MGYYMKNIKTFLMLLITILLVIFVAGCASKDTDKSVTTSNGNNKDTSQDNPAKTYSGDKAATAEQVTPADASGSSSDANAADASKASGSSQPKEIKGTVKDLYPDATIDPALVNINVTSNDPDVVVERMEFTDNRDYEQSPNWSINVTLKNKGDQSKYILGHFDKIFGSSKSHLVGLCYNVYESGDELKSTYDGQFNYQGSHIFNTNSIKLDISSHNIVYPEIDPVFTHLNKTIMETNILGASLKWVVDVKSVKCVVKDESKGWKSVVLELLNVDNGRNLTVFFLDKDGNNIMMDSNTTKNGTIEIPLRSLSPEDLYTIALKV
jgi:hypothetical protein